MPNTLDSAGRVKITSSMQDRFLSGWSEYGHFKGCLPNGFSWQGSPYDSSPTVAYYRSTYAKCSTSDTDGAFLADAPTTWLDKYIAAKVAGDYNMDIGVRVEKDSTNYAEFVLFDPGESGYFNLEVNYQSADDAIGAATTTYDVRYSPTEFICLFGWMQDRGGGQWRFFPGLVNEVGLRAIPFIALANFSWTPTQIGLIVRPTVASTRGGYVDWLAGDITF